MKKLGSTRSLFLLLWAAFVSLPVVAGAYDNTPCAGHDRMTKLRCAQYFAYRFSPEMGLCILGIHDLGCPSIDLAPAADLAIDADTRLIVIQFLSALKQGQQDRAFEELMTHIFGGTGVLPNSRIDGAIIADGAPTTTTLPGATSTTTTAHPTTTTTTLPVGGVAAPSGLTATAISQFQIRLAWTNHASNSGVNIYRGGAQVGTVAAGAPGSTTTFLDQGLTANTTYTYVVRACAGSVCSGNSNSATATTQASTAAPSGLTATAISQFQIRLTWTNNATSTQVKLYRSQGVNNGSTLVGTVPSGTTSFLDQGLTPNTTYSYVAQACTSNGTCSANSDPAAATTQADTAAPSGLIATAVSQFQIRLTWTNHAANTQVKIYRLLGPLNGSVLVGTVLSGATSFLDQGLTRNTTYTYVAQACTSTGTCSGDSNQASAQTWP
jgi:hypothetical protein